MKDPTRDEMLDYLFTWGKGAHEFDVEEAIYWFAANHHGGQDTNLYEALSASLYSPGGAVRGPTETSQHLYEELEKHYGA